MRVTVQISQSGGWYKLSNSWTSSTLGFLAGWKQTKHEWITSHFSVFLTTSLHTLFVFFSNKPDNTSFCNRETTLKNNSSQITKNKINTPSLHRWIPNAGHIKPLLTLFFLAGFLAFLLSFLTLGCRWGELGPGWVASVPSSSDVLSTLHTRLENE